MPTFPGILSFGWLEAASTYPQRQLWTPACLGQIWLALFSGLLTIRNPFDCHDLELNSSIKIY